MHIKSWVALAFATVAFAKPTVEGVADAYNTQDAAALRKAFAALTPAITAMDGSLKAITADNVATSIKDLNAKGHALADALSSAAKTVSGSPPLKGIQDAIGLLTPGKAIANALNATTQSLTAKLDIIKNSKQTALVVDLLKTTMKPFIDFQNAIMTQIPTSMTASIPKDMLPKDAQVLELMDGLIQQIADIMDGKAAAFTIPANLPMPSGFPAGGFPGGAPGGIAGLPGVGAAPAPTAAPASPAPAAPKPASSPKAAPPKGVAPKGPPSKGTSKGTPSKGTFVIEEFEA